MLKELNFAMQDQESIDWCWAASAVSLARFYNEHTQWSSQCALACNALRRPNCCQDKDSDGCSVAFRLDRALEIVGVLKSVHEGSLHRIQDIKKQIDAGFPIGVRIKWPSGRGHFLVICGYDDAGPPVVSVKDPQFGESVCPLPRLLENYQESGSLWSDTYLTHGEPLAAISFNESRPEILERSKVKELNIRRQRKIDFFKSHDARMISSLPVYVLWINSLNQKKRKPKTSKFAIRVLGASADEYLYDFENNSKDSRLIQVIVDPAYLKDFNETVESINMNRYELGDKFMLRIIRQPELNVEAFWLHCAEAERDEFVIIKRSAGLEKGKKYSKDVFLEAVALAAARKPRITNQS